MDGIKLYLTLTNRNGQLLLRLMLNAGSFRQMVRMLATLLLSQSFQEKFAKSSTLAVAEAPVAPAPPLHPLDHDEVKARLAACTTDDNDIWLVKNMFDGKRVREAAEDLNMAYDTARSRLGKMYDQAFGYFNLSIEGKKFEIFIHYLMTGELKRQYRVRRLKA